VLEGNPQFGVDLPMPGNVGLERAPHFAESLAPGQKDRRGAIKTIIEDKVREVI
jgi:hypothetical protein